MLKMVLPKIECEASTKNYGRYSISPLETGYGVTIGNALRRVLLASLTGAAVTSVQVAGVFHEFSPIAGAKEDMTTLILNTKKIRVRYFAENPIRMSVSTHGRTEVTAADIEAPPDVEIINPELHLLTLDSSDTDLDIEFVVERGRGYSPVEERAKQPIGQIPIDAVFSPILKTSISVEPTRVGQVTDYDRLILEIWTDGTIRPSEALSSAAQILVRHLAPVAGFSEVPVEEFKEAEASKPGPSSQVYDRPIEELELSMRAYNCLKRAGITKVGEILDRWSKGQTNELLAIRNFGQKSLAELLGKMREKGYLPAEDVDSARLDGLTDGSAEDDEETA
ncbi:MAG: DNA-directed RNA polymerase subunit alpha [Chloroflexi bacterium ADurb.Bin180]|nr:MAG: DNA-directed RNA polymerase subunit alpha [Chloroflexi bacterium ADurb.Bin180]HQJ50688.1 DNA-directed RNA polymerase subunit alpha [Anaerolineae bacterium]